MVVVIARKACKCSRKSWKRFQNLMFYEYRMMMVNLIIRLRNIGIHNYYRIKNSLFFSPVGRVSSPPAPAPQASNVFSINMRNPQQLPLENAVIKLETPMSNSKDYKIEQVKVTMLVKDEKSNSLQEINGDWTPE
jgi:hypothetical protein